MTRVSAAFHNNKQRKNLQEGNVFARFFNFGFFGQNIFKKPLDIP
jgi:hypothetical protein